MSSDTNKLEGFWIKESSGGAMGSHLLVMRGDRYVAHLYEDGQSSQDWQDLQALIEGRESQPCSPSMVQLSLRRSA